MYETTCMSHWAWCRQESIKCVRDRHNQSVNSLFVSCLYKCIENIEDGVHIVTSGVPADILNLLANKAMRYNIDISHLLKCLANSRVSKLDITNYGVGKKLPVDLYKELSNCRNLSQIDLYGFQVDSSQLCKLRFLTNLVSLSFGCDRRVNFLSQELINTLLCHKLTTLQLRNFIMDFKNIELFPFLTSISFSKCAMSQTGDLTRHPPLKHVTISNPVKYFGFVRIPDFTLFTATLETLRLSHLSLDTDTLFKSQLFPFLTELEITFCEYNRVFPDLIQCVHKYCPNLSKLIFLSDTQVTSEIKHSQFQIITLKSPPPVLTELILNHFHNPETAFAILKSKPTDNTYYWAKSCRENRATVSSHFLIIANLLYLNPTCKQALDIVDIFWIRMDLWDKEILCGEDYLMPLVYYHRQRKEHDKFVVRHLKGAWNSNFIDTKMIETLIARIFGYR